MTYKIFPAAQFCVDYYVKFIIMTRTWEKSDTIGMLNYY